MKLQLMIIASHHMQWSSLKTSYPNNFAHLLSGCPVLASNFHEQNLWIEWLLSSICNKTWTERNVTHLFKKRFMQTSRKREDEKKYRQLEEEEQERTIIQFNRTCDTISWKVINCRITKGLVFGSKIVSHGYIISLSFTSHEIDSSF